MCPLLPVLATLASVDPTDHTSWPQLDVCSDQSQGSLFYALRHIGLQGRAQAVVGPMQDDEALLLFALTRAAGVNRALELGGLGGFSARTILEAVQCTRQPAVYTVDLALVPVLGRHHRVLQKGAEQVTAADLGGEPFGLLVLDCHHYPATKQLLKNVLRWRLLRRDGMLFLHDTGRHPAGGANSSGVIHQPVERLIAMWLERYDCAASWQRLVVHDDDGHGATPTRHGVTVLQRKVSLGVPQRVCQQGAHGFGGTGPESVRECLRVQTRHQCSRQAARGYDADDIADDFE